MATKTFPLVMIPRKLSKGEELVVLPRKEYELLRRVFVDFGRIPAEPLSAYKNAVEIKRVLRQAIRDARRGRLLQARSSRALLRRA